MADHMAWICCACTIVYEYISPLFHIYKWYIYRHICERQTLIGCCLTGWYFTLPTSLITQCVLNDLQSHRKSIHHLPLVAVPNLYHSLENFGFKFDLVLIWRFCCFKSQLFELCFVPIFIQLSDFSLFFLVELPFFSQFLSKFLHNWTIEQQKKIRVV